MIIRFSVYLSKVNNLAFLRKVFICFVLCSLLTSCYAFLQADRLVYAGTVAKKTASVIQIDTVTVEVKNSTDFNVIK